MTFTVSRQNGIAIIRLEEKKLDSASSVELRKRLVALLQEDVDRFILDFEMVEYIDSSGLGVLISLLKQLGDKGDMMLCRIQEASIGNILHLTRMDQLFEIADSCEAAILRMQA